MMKKTVECRSTVLLILLMSLVLVGCSRREEGLNKTASSRQTNVMLKAGNGALLVTFPQTADFQRETWMAQIELEGPYDTGTLPRVPLADQRTVIVLDIPPGEYSVVAQSWTRRSHAAPPQAGGSLDYVKISAGKVMILEAKLLGIDVHPFVNTPLERLSSALWTLPLAEQLPAWIAEVVSDSRGG